ncbi:Serine/threonine-protein phosphatase PP1-alpha catalytic subunit, partial [Anas platyrhynchos]
CRAGAAGAPGQHHAGPALGAGSGWD